MKKLKNGHSLFRSLFLVILLGVLACILASLLYGDAEITETELKDMQAKAEQAYKTVYFEQVKAGVREDVKVADVIKQLRKDGVNLYTISSYKFTIEEGKIKVEPAKGEVVKDK
ncbi:MAG: hypothetical protein IKL68_06665 [Clostridia bacterium]|nr:hypothetical protein [Clostridia bacterium]